jgi:hypothetical protein
MAVLGTEAVDKVEEQLLDPLAAMRSDELRFARTKTPSFQRKVALSATGP